jgi:heme acquisition protein HasR
LEPVLNAYAQTGYSRPTSNEMYMYRQVMKAYFDANPDLAPEKNLSFQLGLNCKRENWRARNDQFDLGINLYRNRIRNYIVHGGIVTANEPIDISLKGKGQIERDTSVNNIEPFIHQA